MNSIGILYTLKNSSEPSKANVSADLHVNYWKLPIGRGDYKRFLDFGVFINEVAQDVSSICFYFPFAVDSKSLKDLGKSLSTSELICTLFNNDYEVRNINGSPNYYMISPSSYTDSKYPFWLYVLGDNNFKVTEVKPYGSIVSVQILSTPRKKWRNSTSYYRKETKKKFIFPF